MRTLAVTSVTEPGGFGTFAQFSTLTEQEKTLVDNAMAGAAKAYCPMSKFAVGCSILAENEKGEEKIFTGCNVENSAITVGICAERNVATTAAGEGFKKFRKIAVVASILKPGGSPCGLCRQFLSEFSSDAELLLVTDLDKNVRREPARSLLPEPKGSVEKFESLSAEEKKLVDELVAQKAPTHAPYTGKPRRAMVVARNKDGVEGFFHGSDTELATFGGSVPALVSAISCAATAGHFNVTGAVINGARRLDGYTLQTLREFGRDVIILFVGDDKSVVHSSIDELLPDSFGPEAL